MVFWPPTHVISNPLPIVFTPLSLCPLYIKSLYMVLWPLAPMVYRKPCLWYIDPHCLWYFNPTTQVMINPYLCYIKPYVYGILILPMVFWPPNYGTSIAFVLNCLLSKTAKECFTPLIVSYIYQSSCGKKGGSTYHDEFNILCVFDVALCNKVCQWYNLGLKLHS